MKNLFIAAITALSIVAFFAFKPAGGNEKVTMIVSHEVQDFAKWKAIFDGHEADRTKAGVKVIGVYQSVDNANFVTVISEVPNAETAKAFGTNPDMKTTMEKAGVISKPEVKVLNQIK